MIKCEIVADSTNEFGQRITSILCTFPRYILAELNTHRMFSRNSASSRAIPFKKMVEMVKENPFIPMAWQKDHKGMQGTEYINPNNIPSAERLWLESRDLAVTQAIKFAGNDITKQLCNRLLEPFMWHTALITSTEWENFFDLRCPQYEFNSFSTNNVYHYMSRKDLLKNHPDNNIPDNWTDLDWLKINKGQADIHMMFLAEAIWDAMNESKPKELKAGDWHIPWGDKIEHSKLLESATDQDLLHSNETIHKVKVSTGMAARTSYTVVGEEKEVFYETLINIHDKMIKANPFHASPFEHCAQAMGKDDLDKFIKMEDGVIEEGWCRNFKGFKQYRYLIENFKTK